MDTKSATAILNLPIESIRLLDNLREVKPDDDLEELARDLVRHGFLQPLLVQPTETNDCFELVFRLSSISRRKASPNKHRSLSDHVRGSFAACQGTFCREPLSGRLQSNRESSFFQSMPC